MGTITVTDGTGSVCVIGYEDGDKLMEVLRNHDLVRGECGGLRICATCHVLIDADWYSRLGPAHTDEHDLIDGTGEYRSGRSRLSCQIICGPAIDGLSLTVAPAT